MSHSSKTNDTPFSFWGSRKDDTLNRIPNITEWTLNEKYVLAAAVALRGSPVPDWASISTLMGRRDYNFHHEKEWYSERNCFHAYEALMESYLRTNGEKFSISSPRLTPDRMQGLMKALQKACEDKMKEAKRLEYLRLQRELEEVKTCDEARLQELAKNEKYLAFLHSKEGKAMLLKLTEDDLMQILGDEKAPPEILKLVKRSKAADKFVVSGDSAQESQSIPLQQNSVSNSELEEHISTPINGKPADCADVESQPLQKNTHTKYLDYDEDEELSKHYVSYSELEEHVSTPINGKPADCADVESQTLLKSTDTRVMSKLSKHDVSNSELEEHLSTPSNVKLADGADVESQPLQKNTDTKNPDSDKNKKLSRCSKHVVFNFKIGDHLPTQSNEDSAATESQDLQKNTDATVMSKLSKHDVSNSELEEHIWTPINGKPADCADVESQPLQKNTHTKYLDYDEDEELSKHYVSYSKLEEHLSTPIIFKFADGADVESQPLQKNTDTKYLDYDEDEKLSKHDVSNSELEESISTPIIRKPADCADVESQPLQKSTDTKDLDFDEDEKLFKHNMSYSELEEHISTPINVKLGDAADVESQPLQKITNTKNLDNDEDEKLSKRDVSNSELEEHISTPITGNPADCAGVESQPLQRNTRAKDLDYDDEDEKLSKHDVSNSELEERISTPSNVELADGADVESQPVQKRTDTKDLDYDEDEKLSKHNVSYSELEEHISTPINVKFGDGADVESQHLQKITDTKILDNDEDEKLSKCDVCNSELEENISTPRNVKLADGADVESQPLHKNTDTKVLDYDEDEKLSKRDVSNSELEEHISAPITRKRAEMERQPLQKNTDAKDLDYDEDEKLSKHDVCNSELEEHTSTPTNVKLADRADVESQPLQRNTPAKYLDYDKDEKLSKHNVSNSELEERISTPITRKPADCADVRSTDTTVMSKLSKHDVSTSELEEYLSTPISVKFGTGSDVASQSMSLSQDTGDKNWDSVKNKRSKHVVSKSNLREHIPTRSKVKLGDGADVESQPLQKNTDTKILDYGKDEKLSKHDVSNSELEEHISTLSNVKLADGADVASQSMSLSQDTGDKNRDSVKNKRSKYVASKSNLREHIPTRSKVKLGDGADVESQPLQKSTDAKNLDYDKDEKLSKHDVSTSELEEHISTPNSVKFGNGSDVESQSMSLSQDTDDKNLDSVKNKWSKHVVSNSNLREHIPTRSKVKLGDSADVADVECQSVLSLRKTDIKNSDSDNGNSEACSSVQKIIHKRVNRMSQSARQSQPLVGLINSNLPGVDEKKVIRIGAKDAIPLKQGSSGPGMTLSSVTTEVLVRLPRHPSTSESKGLSHNIEDSQPVNDVKRTTSQSRVNTENILRLYAKIVMHKGSKCFGSQVHPGRIKRPVDLNIIKNRMQNGEIQTITKLERDLSLMFLNFEVCNMISEKSKKLAGSFKEYCYQVIQKCKGGNRNTLATVTSMVSKPPKPPNLTPEVVKPRRGRKPGFSPYKKQKTGLPADTKSDKNADMIDKGSGLGYQTRKRREVIAGEETNSSIMPLKRPRGRPRKTN